MIATSFLVACGADPEDTDVDGLDTDVASTTEGYDIPKPGNDDSRCLDTEPNDTPEQAVPCGLVHEDPGAGTGAVYPLEWGSLSEDDPVDWYVFKTAQDTDALHQFAWWNDDVNLADLAIYKVDEGELTEIWRSEESATDGENMAFLDFEVEGRTTYLLEVYRAEGVGDYGL